MTIPENHILVIFGASGDLTKRKLIPDVFNLKRQKLLPDGFAILGVSRTEISDEEFRKEMKSAIKEFGNNNPDENMIDDFIKSIYYISINTKAVEDF
ncbi:MAG: glucose-6-phosphate dehydrogenase, partial [Melioribacteraceae bacterium]